MICLDSPTPSSLHSRKGSVFKPFDFSQPLGLGLGGSAGTSSHTLSSSSSQPRPRPNLEFSKLALLDSPGYIDTSAVEKVGKRALKRKRKEERERTKGSAWFNMGAPEMTDERKNDLEALRLRGALDTKRFYKRNNITTRPKYFQVGRILESPADFYHSRVPKKQRKNTIAEEMVAEVSSTVSHL